MMRHLLLENPWPLAIVLTATAAVIRLVGRRTQRLALSYAALGVLGLAVGAVFLAYGVTTEREALRERTNALVQATLAPTTGDQSAAPSDREEEGTEANTATAALDLKTIGRLIAEDAALRGPHGEVWIRAGQVRTKLKQQVQRNPLASQRITSLTIDVPSPTHALAHLRLRTTFQHEVQPPTHTAWAITWQRPSTDAPWRITDVQWMQWMNRPPPHLNW